MKFQKAGLSNPLDLFNVIHKSLLNFIQLLPLIKQNKSLQYTPVQYAYNLTYLQNIVQRIKFDSKKFLVTNMQISPVHLSFTIMLNNNDSYKIAVLDDEVELILRSKRYILVTNT